MKSEKGEYALAALARQALEHRLAGGPAPCQPADDLQLREKGATFVTITKNGQLRGCIGNLQPVKPLFQSICDNAVSAALHDRRFTPLHPEELREVALQVSVLTRPLELAYTDPQDLLTKLRPGIDGVILGDGQRSATFLPQVWEQLPQPEIFLNHLCQKAGLTPRAWQEQKLQIQIYQVECYTEVDDE